MLYKSRVKLLTLLYQFADREVHESRRPTSWLRGPAVEHWSLANVLSLSCARLVADG